MGIPITNKRVRDLTGQRFHKLTVIEYLGQPPKDGVGNRSSRWACRCDCGKELVSHSNRLLTGNTKSCGCLAVRHAVVSKHGMVGSPTYRSWQSMIVRCCNPENKSHKDYGAIGIGLCERWRSFANFLADMGERTEISMTLDRIDNSKGYEPGNCRWANKQDQARNTRKNVYVEYQGQKKLLLEWCEELGLVYMTAYQRLRRGLSPEQAFSTEHMNRGRPKIATKIQEVPLSD